MSIVNKQNNRLIFFGKNLLPMMVLLVSSESKSSHPSYGAISDKVIPSCFVLETSQPMNEDLQSDSKSSLTPLLASQKSLSVKNGLVRNKEFTNLNACQAQKHVHFDISTEERELNRIRRIEVRKLDLIRRIEEKECESEICLGIVCCSCCISLVL